MRLPRNLSFLKSRKKMCALVALMLLVLCCICGRCYAGAALVLLGASINVAVLKKMYKQKMPFEPTSKIRNIDYLVIGDMCRTEHIVPAGKTCLQIMAPSRSLYASYEIMRHTFSILRDFEGGGILVLAVRDKYAEKHNFSLFDIPFLHPVTIRKLGLARLARQTRLPLLFAPVRSLRFLLNLRRRTYIHGPCPDRAISEFCKERNIELIYLHSP